MSEWTDLLSEAKNLGIATHGMKKPEVEAAVRAALHGGTQQMPPEEQPPLVVEPGDRAAIQRTNAQQHWWCPLCDHSQTVHQHECRGCGAARDGDEVIAP